RHTISKRDWSSDVCSSDLENVALQIENENLKTFLDKEEKTKKIETDKSINLSAHCAVKITWQCFTKKDFIFVTESCSASIEKVRSEERRVGKECRARWRRK